MPSKTTTGLIGTALWVVIVVGVSFRGGTDEFVRMTPNEWGDFLAGLVAPIAFLWLILGYFQQGEELRQNTKALELQQKELQNQVEETRFLVRESAAQAKAAVEMLELERQQMKENREKEILKAQPILQSTGGDAQRLSFVNIGSVAREPRITIESPNIRISISPSDVIAPGTEGEISIEGLTAWPALFNLTYIDALGEQQLLQLVSNRPGGFTTLSQSLLDEPPE